MALRRSVMRPAVDGEVVAAGARYLIFVRHERHSSFAQLRQKVVGYGQLELQIKNLRLFGGFSVEAEIEACARLLLPNLKAADKPIQAGMGEFLRVYDGVRSFLDRD